MVLCVSLVRADVDNSLYEVDRRLSRPQEQQRYREEIEREQAAAAAAARAAEEVRQRQAEARQRAEAARPWPERLTEQRCIGCHSALNYSRNAHTWPGWATVVLRMRAVNHAPLSVPEMLTITGYLSLSYPAWGIDAALEWLALSGLVLLPFLLWGVLRWIMRHRVRRGPSAA